jgi:RimJ/RimL family protein N-acetyltransferase
MGRKLPSAGTETNGRFPGDPLHQRMAAKGAPQNGRKSPIAAVRRRANTQTDAQGYGSCRRERRLICEAPRIETDRLILRAFRLADLDPLAKIWADEAIVRFIGGKPLSREEAWRRSIGTCGQWPITGYGYWIAQLTNDATPIGTLGFGQFKRNEMSPDIDGEPEFGYTFATHMQGQGLAFEGCSAALAWADANLSAVSYPAVISADNERSIRLALKLGFKAEGEATWGDQTMPFFRRPRRGARP